MNIWEICTTFVCIQKYKHSTYISEFKTEFGEQQKTKWDKKKERFCCCIFGCCVYFNQTQKVQGEKREKKYQMSK